MTNLMIEEGFPEEKAGTDIDFNLVRLSVSNHVVENFRLLKVDEIPLEYSPKKKDLSKLINGSLEKCLNKEDIFSSIVYEGKDGKQSKQFLGSIPKMTAAEAIQALESSADAYDSGAGVWPNMSVEERITCVENFLDFMESKKEEVVKYLVLEISKSVKDAESEFDRTVEYCRRTIEEVRKIDNDDLTTLTSEGITARVSRSSKGVVLCMGPFNYPLNESLTTLIPALLMGNTVLFKTPKIGALLFSPLLEGFANCFPEGVVNSLNGDGQEIITPIMKTGKIDVLSFIGSTFVANKIIENHPNKNRLSLVLGLGAKNPVIVTESANLEDATDKIVKGALSFNGQRCTALKLVFVAEKIAEKFNALLIKKIEKLKIGMPWENNVEITPLAEPGKVEFLNTLIEDATAGGARILNIDGGTAKGNLFKPAVLYPVTDQMKLYKEEQFGPIVPIVPFSDIQEPISYIKKSEFGQQASIFTGSFDEANNFAKKVTHMLGRVNINTQCQRSPDNLPFSGKKDAALGVLSIRDALEAFSTKTVVAGLESDIIVKLVVL